ncbi:winged helix-turn-helix domain-containing protein [Streptomyces sp. NPDC006539]|uniref:winged helix-turn-helix domain-containing protein n=1 Tax=Streptomyces sp. NPDC006539 TaxID=3155352 RepID=UPI0033B8C52B
MPTCVPLRTVRAVDFDPTRPKWEQIADQLRARIADGTLPPRALVSEVQLEAEFEVARGTVRKATAALRDEGLLITTPGLGSFVA